MAAPLLTWGRRTESEEPMSQCELILNHLRNHGSITPLEALQQYGCFRLGARIWDLRRRGEDITAKTLTLGNGKQVAMYSLAERTISISGSQA